MKRKWITLSMAGALAVLLGLPAMGAPHPDRYHGGYRADRLTTRGRISSMALEGDRYRVELDHGGYIYYVPAATVRGRDLRVGSDVRLGGIVAGDTVNVDFVAFPGERYYVTDPNYRAVPYGSSGWLSGTVERVNRHLGYLTVRDDATGDWVKIDVRHMNMRRPINVWNIHAGNHISVNGSWENRDTFDARRVEY